MILQEGTPSLRRWPAAAHHVLAHAALPDVDAEFEQFAVDAGRTPSWILTAHPADQVSRLPRRRRPSGLSAPNLPSPEQAEALPMPDHDRLRFNDDQGRAPIAPDTG